MSGLLILAGFALLYVAVNRLARAIDRASGR